MFLCCELSYEKYIKPDGSIDRAIWMDIVLARRREGKETPDIEELCKCDCHRQDKVILH